MSQMEENTVQWLRVNVEANFQQHL